MGSQIARRRCQWLSGSRLLDGLASTESIHGAEGFVDTYLPSTCLAA